MGGKVRRGTQRAAFGQRAALYRLYRKGGFFPCAGGVRPHSRRIGVPFLWGADPEGRFCRVRAAYRRANGTFLVVRRPAQPCPQRCVGKKRRSASASGVAAARNLLFGEFLGFFLNFFLIWSVYGGKF